MFVFIVPSHALIILSMDLHYIFMQAEVQADASVVKRGRNLTVVAIQFKLKKTGKLIYTTRATLYNMPAAKL